MSEWFEFYESEKETPEINRPMRITLTGSSIYEDKIKIKKILFEFKQRFKDSGKQFVIVSGGRPNGADTYVKKYSLDFGLDYKEFNPAFTQHNLYSALSKTFYNKPYNIGHVFHRNRLLVDYSDYIVVFKKSDSDDNEISELIKYAELTEKQIRIVS